MAKSKAVEMLGAEQLVLVPDEPLQLTSETLPIEVFDHIEVIEASAAMCESVRTVGLLQPPLFRVTSMGHYEIVFGRRRLYAARKAGFTEIDVLVTDATLAIADLMTLTENAIRRANTISEYDSITKLVKAGADIKTISGKSGMAVGTIKARLKLGNLTPPLLDAFRAGKVSTSVAEGAAGLPKVLQEKLAKGLETKGKITAKDLHEIRLARTQQKMNALPDALFDLDEHDETNATAGEKSIFVVLAEELQPIIDKMPDAVGGFRMTLQDMQAQLIDLSLSGDWSEGSDDEDPDSFDNSGSLDNDETSRFATEPDYGPKDPPAVHLCPLTKEPCDDEWCINVGCKGA